MPFTVKSWITMRFKCKTRVRNEECEAQLFNLGTTGKNLF